MEKGVRHAEEEANCRGNPPNKLKEAEVVIASCSTAVEKARLNRVSEQAFYRQRTEYKGLRVYQPRRPKQLEIENRRLKRAESELTLENQIIKLQRRETSEPRRHRHGVEHV